MTFGRFAEFLGPQIVTLARKKTIQESKVGSDGATNGAQQRV